MPQQTLNALNKLAIFKMSLGSKELFHSNFLEFLWDEDNGKFINLVKRLLGKGADVLPEGIEYNLDRERENFDICIYHLDKKKIVYDVIIENKVKSIPNIDQLHDYEKKTKSQCRYLLLSLIENFADKKKIEEEGLWTIVNYEALKSAIDDIYGNSSTYISDYSKFIGLMHQLQRKILTLNFVKEELFAEYNTYKKYRLHDLYLKIRGLRFIEHLQDRLSKKNISSQVVKVGGKALRKAYCEGKIIDPNVGVYLNWNIFRGAGQIAAYVYKGGKHIYEVVLQNGQFRHGINYYDENEPNIAIPNIWEKVKEDDFIKDMDLPKRDKAKPYCQYSPDYVYRYNKIDGTIIDKLLDQMVEDIETIIARINKK